MKVMPCPSPTGRNDERLYLIRAPYGTPAGALDQALKRASDKARDRKRFGRDEDPDQDRNLGELRRKLEHMLSQCLKGEQYSAAMDLMDEAGLPGGQTYGDVDGQDEDGGPDVKYPDHKTDTDAEPKMRAFLSGKLSEDDLEEAMSQMPRSAIEDRRRGGRDRRHAMDSRSMTAAESFEQFYGASRIRHAT
jgi:hypothetical protein